MSNIQNIVVILDFIKTIFIILATNYVIIKITNFEVKFRNIVIIGFATPIVSVLTLIAKYNGNTYYSYLIFIMILSMMNWVNYSYNIDYSIIITIVSFILSYIIYMLSVIISFVPCFIFKINNDNINFIIIVFVYIYLVYKIFKLKKLKYGLSFFKSKIQNLYITSLTINICVIILFVTIIIKEYGILVPRQVGLAFIIISLSMFITIKQSFDLYYKQNLLEKDLKETKEELEAKKKEVEKLEIENLEFSKTSHSLAHKQKALEYRLSQLTKLGKINEDEEIDIKNELENISEEMYKEPEDIELAKTDITSIDNMFSYMQSECIKDNIKFELQVVGNIHYMVNNLISENELEILIADHIKDAIIAINHSDNSNRSILVRIGKIDNVYSLYIYDSGIEFTKEVLDNLGKKPITTHADTGGTGIGFMNTFDTLNKTKASLIINEIGKPCEDNFTKALIFKFDNQNEFKVNSYKNEVVV